MRTKIYALRENGFVRYVGKTSKSLAWRFGGHMVGARQGEDTRKDRWIRRMLKQGKLPTVSFIEEVDGNGNTEEITWIKYFRDHGVDLTNTTDGGDGGIDSTGFVAKKISKKLKGRPATENARTPEVRAHLSRVRKGKPCTWGDKISKTLIGHPGASKGEHRSETTVKNLKVAWVRRKAFGWVCPLRGRKKTPEHREAMRLAWIERKRKGT